MAKLLGGIIKKKYSGKGNLSIDDILEWEVWPGLMKIFGEYS